MTIENKVIHPLPTGENVKLLISNIGVNFMSNI